MLLYIIGFIAFYAAMWHNEKNAAIGLYSALFSFPAVIVFALTVDMGIKEVIIKLIISMTFIVASLFAVFHSNEK